MGAAKKLTLVVDFEAVLADIRATGRSFQQISEATGISKSALVEQGGGLKRPVHHHGERLIVFWQQRTGKPREQLPMTSIF